MKSANQDGFILKMPMEFGQNCMNRLFLLLLRNLKQFFNKEFVSIKVRQLLELLGIETTHEERLEIDRIIEERTGLYCDEGVDLLTKEEFLEIVYEAKRRLKKRKETEKSLLYT